MLLKEYPKIYQDSYLVVKDYDKDGAIGYELSMDHLIQHLAVLSSLAESNML